MTKKKKDIKNLLNELVTYQEKKLLKFGEKIIPHITSDDILQPNDYPELENHPYFRYEEGFLKGLQAARAAILAWESE